MIDRLENTNVKAVIEKITPNAANILAKTLINDLQKNNPDLKTADKLISSKDMQALKKQVLKTIKEFDEKRKLPYHNAAHTENVFNRTLQLLENSSLNQADKQLLKMAALFHDFQHGKMGNTDSNGRLGNTDSNGRLSYEELSAIIAEKQAKKMGLTLKQRLVLYGLIIGTTFSNPAIKPRTRMEKLLVIADLGGFTNTSKEWLLESIYVTMEIPFQHRPRSITEWLKEQLNFLKYVKQRLTPEAKKLNWHIALERKTVLIKKLLKNQTYNKAYMPVINKLRKTLSEESQRTLV